MILICPDTRYAMEMKNRLSQHIKIYPSIYQDTRDGLYVWIYQAPIWDNVGTAIINHPSNHHKWVL